MLLVDKRVGSRELVPYLKHLEIPVELVTLPFGDFACLGRGEGGEPFPVAVERKTLGDFLTSMANGRFPSYQVPGLARTFSAVWMVLEGRWRADVMTGVIMVPGGGKKKSWVAFEWAQSPTGQLTMTTLESLILTVELKCGCRVRRTQSQDETCRFLSGWYRWWTGKDFDQHKSHLKLHLPSADKALLLPPTVCRMVAAALPQIGWERSLAVSKHFGSVRAMANATEKEWQTVDGIGKGIAKNIVNAITVEGVLA